MDSWQVLLEDLKGDTEQQIAGLQELQVRSCSLRREKWEDGVFAFRAPLLTLRFLGRKIREHS